MVCACVCYSIQKLMAYQRWCRVLCSGIDIHWNSSHDVMTTMNICVYLCNGFSICSLHCSLCGRSRSRGTGLLDCALTLQTTLLLRATQLRASVLHVDRENNYTACVMHICVYKQRNKSDCVQRGVYKGSRDLMWMSHAELQEIIK